jgi:two-component system NtrC family sensor kinase
MAKRRTAGNPGNAIVRTRIYFAVIVVLFTVGIALSLYQDILHAREDRYLLAVSTGKVLFRTVVATRSWNTNHGGVYVPVTETFRPNPYLTTPDRDVRTTTGVQLTKVNPAYMTRLIGEILKEEGYSIHLTSLKALRPGNKPDDWERAALGKFEKGSVVEHAIAGFPGTRVFHYMEPLKTEAACLDCHGQQGDRIGEIRGGIRISFPYAPYDHSIRVAERHAIVMHALSFGAGLSILLFLGQRIVNLIGRLQETLRKVRTLEGILPMCSICKKIRKEGGPPKDPEAWVPVDFYITDRSEASVSHGICPECMIKFYGPGGEYGLK